MSDTKPTTTDDREQERYNQHVERVTDLIAQAIEQADAVSESKAGRGVIHVHLRSGERLGEPVLLAINENGARLDYVEIRGGNTSIARLYARVVVPDERLREGWTA